MSVSVAGSVIEKDSNDANPVEVTRVETRSHPGEDFLSVPSITSTYQGFSQNMSAFILDPGVQRFQTYEWPSEEMRQGISQRRG